MKNIISCIYVITSILLTAFIIIAEKVVWLFERSIGAVGWNMWGSLPSFIWLLPIFLIVLAIITNGKINKA